MLDTTKCKDRDLPGSPVVKTPHFPCRGCRFDPYLGNEDPTCHTARPKIKKKIENAKLFDLIKYFTYISFI